MSDGQAFRDAQDRSFSLIVRVGLCAGLLASSSALAADPVPGSCPKVKIKIDGHRTVYWNDVPLANRVELESNLFKANHLAPRPCLNLAIPENNLADLGPVVMLLQKYRFRIAFVTEPPP
jgi:hypothetical protein